MAIPANVGKTVIKGTGPGSEIWQTGFWWARPDTLDMSDLAEFRTYTADLVSPIGGMWSTIRAKIYGAYSYTGFTSYWYRGGPGAALVADNPQTPSAGTYVTTGSPMDTCCVVSVISEAAGRRGRGRMYLPRHEACSTTTGQFLTDASVYVGAIGTLFHNLIAATHSMQPRIVSQADGVARPVATLKGDQLPDVQRRRENRLAKGTTSVLTAPF
jgi:hypothetical protein